MMKYPGSRSEEKYIRSIARKTVESLKQASEQANPKLEFPQIISLVSTIIKNLTAKFNECKENVDQFELLINQGGESDIGDIAGYKLGSQGSARRAMARYYHPGQPPSDITALLENKNFLELQKTIFARCFTEICQANRPKAKRQNEEDEISHTSESSHSDDTPGGSPHNSGDEKSVKRVRFAKPLGANDENENGSEKASAATGRG